MKMAQCRHYFADAMKRTICYNGNVEKWDEFRPTLILSKKEMKKMKYCPHCGYSPIHDDASQCPCCGEDISEQIPYDYPSEEADPGYYADAAAHETKKRKRWKDQPLKMRLALVIIGFVIIVGACIAVLCLL